jgi:hypothetical protein
MKNRLFVIAFIAFPLSAKPTRLRTYSCVAIVLLAGCTATQTRWDATNIRKEVMVYYNDQIMDNLIKAKNHLPFVHVDVTLLTSQGSSQISGTIGAGETSNNTSTQQETHQTVTTNTAGATVSHAVAGTVGVVATITHMATRPFTYSVTPQRTETLSIQAAPALGSQAMVSPTTEPNESPEPTDKPTWEETKKTIETETTSADGKKTWSKTESRIKPSPKPKLISIYCLYEKYAKCPSEGGVLSESSIRPRENSYVPGTLKRWGTQYYYVLQRSKDGYYEFCKQLFTKGQSQTGSLETALQRTQAAAALPSR